MNHFMFFANLEDNGFLPKLVHVLCPFLWWQWRVIFWVWSWKETRSFFRISKKEDVLSEKEESFLSLTLYSLPPFLSLLSSLRLSLSPLSFILIRDGGHVCQSGDKGTFCWLPNHNTWQPKRTSDSRCIQNELKARQESEGEGNVTSILTGQFSWTCG